MEIYFMPSRSSINKFKVLIALNDIKDDLIFGKDRSTQKKGHKNESHGPLCNTKFLGLQVSHSEGRRPEESLLIVEILRFAQDDSFNLHTRPSPNHSSACK